MLKVASVFVNTVGESKLEIPVYFVQHVCVYIGVYIWYTQRI